MMMINIKLLALLVMFGQTQSMHSKTVYEYGDIYKRYIQSPRYLQFEIYSAVNARSNVVNTTTSVSAINILDGVVLTEAIRYAVSQASRYLGITVSYRVYDIKGNQIPFHGYYDKPFFSAVRSWQMPAYLYFRKMKMTDVAPFVSMLPFSDKEVDHSTNSGNRRKNFAAVPPSSLEVEALVDILSKLGWTFVKVITTTDEIGQEKVEEFQNSASEKGICIEAIVRISNTAKSNEMSEAVKTLKQKTTATVVVSLVESSQINGILHTDIRGLQLITGTSFRASRNDITFNTNTAKGLLILQHDDTYDEGFYKYFMSLQLSSNAYSWFSEFWSEIFQCKVPPALHSRYGKYNSYSKHCTGNETLTKDLVDIRYALVKPVLNSIRTMLCAIKKSNLTTKCNYCPYYYNFVCPYYYHYVCNTKIMVNSLKYFGDSDCILNGTGYFNNEGFINRKYLILNFDGNGYEEVESWHFNETTQKGALNLSKDSIVCNWGTHETKSCYSKCKDGEIEDRGPDGKVCCYKCIKCSAIDEIVQNNTCIKCEMFEVANSSRKKCVPLPRIFIESKRKTVGILGLAATIGLLLTIGTIVCFVKYRHSRVVKSTGRHLSIVMMLSVIVSLCAPIIFFFKPTVILCGVQKIMLGQSLGAFYIPMLLKTIRIYRIFEASKTSIRNPKLVSTKSQMIICFLGIFTNLSLGLLLVELQPTTVKEEAVENYTKVAIVCNHNPLDAVTSLTPCLLLLFACTYFGYKTRHFPSNFNESFRISITMYISCFLWGVYIPLLYMFQFSKQNAFMTNFLTAGLMITLSFVNLIGIFGTAFVKAIKNRQIGPEAQRTSTFATVLVTNTVVATKKYRDIGLDPIEF